MFDGAGTAVVNDQTGPGVLPFGFSAVTCQKYVVPLASAPGV
jgi:hypothetical protein